MLAVENPSLAPGPRTDATEGKAIGLVDELDDPSPGHLSAHPHALSATTTVSDPPPLAERFVKEFLRKGYSVTLVPPSGIIVRTQHGHEFALDCYQAPDPSLYIRHTR